MLFLSCVVLLMFVLIDPVMAYHHDLPADDLTGLMGISDIKWEERVKQYWAHIYLDMSRPVLELGCGNTAVALHTNKVLSSKAPHQVILSPQSDLLPTLQHNKQAAHASFDIISPNQSKPPGTLIVHYDGQDLLQDHLSYLVDEDSPTHILVLECKKELHTAVALILKSHGWHRVKKYIHLAVWCRKTKKSDTEHVGRLKA